MFAHDHGLNPSVPQPTSFDGIKPSFMQWSEEIIIFLAVADYQKFIPLFTAAASSKDVIQADVMFTGVLSDLVEDIKKKAADKLKTESENTDDEANHLGVEISTLKLLEQKSQLCSKQIFMRYTLLHTTSGDPNVIVRKIM